MPKILKRNTGGVSSPMSCRYLERCVGDPNECPFIERGMSGEGSGCGFFGILKAVDEAKNRYTYEDRELIQELMNNFTSRWVDAIKRRKVRAPGPITGKVFEKWVFKELGSKLGSGLVSGKEILLKFGKWRADIVYADRAAIEVKIYFDLQHGLMAKGLLDYSDYKWVFVSFHRAKEKIQDLFELISREYKNRFLYKYIIEQPSKALRDIVDFLKT